MKPFFLLCLIAIVSVSNPAAADYDLTKLKNFSISLESESPVRPPFMACYKKDDRELCYLASNHGSDMNSETFRLIRRAFEEYKPDFVVLEGFESRKGISPSIITEIAERICKGDTSNCEEPQYAVTFANANSIAYTGAEPDDAEVFDKLHSEGYGINEVFAFYFARLVPQFYRDKQIKTMDDIRLRFDAYRKLNPISGVDLTWDNYIDWLKRNINTSVGFSEMVDPLIVAPISNGNKLQIIANKTEWIRDRHILNVILVSVQKYRRVLVIYGHSHFLTQIDVLEDQLGKPTFSRN